MRKLPLVLLLAAPLAHAQIYKCVDAEGRVTYTNSGTEARGCTVLSTEQPVTSVPAPPRAPAAAPQPSPTAFPRVSPETQRARDDTRRQVLEKELAREEEALAQARATLEAEDQRDAPEDRNAPKRTTATVDGKTVTKVGPATLNLGKKEARLQPLRDKVELHERNIEALKKEMGSLR